MARSSKRSWSDVEQFAAWRANTYGELGPDLMQCVRWMHDQDPTGLVIVLRSLRHCGASEVLQQGVSLYWRQLTVEKRTGRAMPEGTV